MKSMRLIIILFSFLLSVFSQKLKFELKTGKKSWDEAKKSCASGGGQLFIPDNKGVWDQFNGYYENKYEGHYYWIGIYYEKDKTPKFLGNRPVKIDFTTIVPNQLQSKKRQCGVLFTEGKFRYIRNADCDRREEYLCEIGRVTTTTKATTTTTTRTFSRTTKKKDEYDPRKLLILLAGLSLLLAILLLACCTKNPKKDRNYYATYANYRRPQNYYAPPTPKRDDFTFYHENACQTK